MGGFADHGAIKQLKLEAIHVPLSVGGNSGRVRLDNYRLHGQFSPEWFSAMPSGLVRAGAMPRAGAVRLVALRSEAAVMLRDAMTNLSGEPQPTDQRPCRGFRLRCRRPGDSSARSGKRCLANRSYT